MTLRAQTFILLSLQSDFAGWIFSFLAWHVYSYGFHYNRWIKMQPVSWKSGSGGRHEYVVNVRDLLSCAETAWHYLISDPKPIQKLALDSLSSTKIWHVFKSNWKKSMKIDVWSCYLLMNRKWDINIKTLAYQN